METLWHRSTQSGHRPFPGRVIAPTAGQRLDIEPGDLLDRSDHVRVVYSVTGRTADDAGIRFIEASGSAGRVRITSAASVKTLASGSNPYVLKRLD